MNPENILKIDFPGKMYKLIGTARDVVTSPPFVKPEKLAVLITGVRKTLPDVSLASRIPIGPLTDYLLGEAEKIARRSGILSEGIANAYDLASFNRGKVTIEDVQATRELIVCVDKRDDLYKVFRDDLGDVSKFLDGVTSTLMERPERLPVRYSVVARAAALAPVLVVGGGILLGIESAVPYTYSTLSVDQQMGSASVFGTSLFSFITAIFTACKTASIIQSKYPGIID